MRKLPGTCIICVDYENVLVRLSQSGHLNMLAFLTTVLQRARQRFEVRQAVVLTRWLDGAARRSVETAGYVCRTLFDPWSETGAQVLKDHTDLLATDPAITMILVAGESQWHPVLRLLAEREQAIVLWSLVPPSSGDRACSSACEPLELPETQGHLRWPRAVILQAIVLAAARLQDPVYGRFALDTLHMCLRSYPALADNPQVWLLIAAQERLFFRQQVAGVLCGQLFLDHPLVQKAFQMQQRVLCVLNVLQSRRAWVAFSVAEKALASVRAFAQSQAVRQAWLELLAAQGTLVIERRNHPESELTVTTIRLPQNNQAIAAVIEQQTERALTRLIVVISDFTAQKGRPGMSFAALIKRLVGPLALIEARTIIASAQEQGIIEIQTSARDGRPAATVFSLRIQHALVRQTLARRDLFLHLIRAQCQERNQAIGLTLMAGLCARAESLSRDNALFWLELLSDEQLLRQQRLSLGAGESSNVLCFNLDHPLLDQLFSPTNASLQKKEVEQ